MGPKKKGDNRPPSKFQKKERLLFRKKISSFGNLVPRDVASEQQKKDAMKATE